MSKSEGWEGGEEGFASLREPHTGLAADSCCKTSSSASRFKERGCGAKIVESVWLREGNNIQ